MSPAAPSVEVPCKGGCGRLVAKYGPHGQQCRECRGLPDSARRSSSRREAGETERAVLDLVEPARAVDQARTRAYQARSNAREAAAQFGEAQRAFRSALEALLRGPRLAQLDARRRRVLDVGAAIDTGGYRDDAGRPI